LFSLVISDRQQKEMLKYATTPYFQIHYNYPSQLPCHAPALPVSLNIANGVTLVVANRIYQEVLYFLCFMFFHDTRISVISFTPIRTLRPNLNRFLQNL
jgi:hypothetical protein